MVVAVIRASLLSVLSSSVYLFFAFLYQALPVSPVAQTLSLENSDTAPDLIRALPADLSPSGCAGRPGYTFSPSVPPLSPSTAAPPLPSPVPTPTSSLSDVFINLQMVKVTHIANTPLPSDAPLPYDSTSSAAPRYASRGMQAILHRRDRMAALSNDSLFRPHLLPATPSPHDSVFSGLAEGSGGSITFGTSRFYLLDGVTTSSAPDVGRKPGDNDLHNILSFNLETQTEKALSSRELKARGGESESGEVKQNFDNLGRLLSGAEGDNSQGSQEVIRKKTSRKGGQTKVPARHLSLRSRGRCPTNQSPAECTERKTRFAPESRLRKTRVTSLKLRGRARVPEAPVYNERREGQRESSLTLGGDGKIRKQGRSRERRITHLSSKSLSRRDGGEGRTSHGTQGNQEQEMPFGQKYKKPAANFRGGRNVKMFPSLSDSRAPSNTVDRKGGQVLSSSSSGPQKQKGNDKLHQGKEDNYKASRPEGEGKRFHEHLTAGGVAGGNARLPEDAATQQRRPRGGSPDSSFHALHVSPFIPDLILNDDGSPQNPHLDQPRASPAPSTTGPRDHPLLANDPRTPTSESLSASGRLRAISKDLDEGDGGERGRAKQREAEIQPWLTDTANAKVPAKQALERDLLLTVRPFKTDGERDDDPVTENESRPQIYETHTNASELQVREQQSSLLLPSLMDDNRTGTRRKVQQGTTTISTTAKKRATSRAPDVPLLDTEGSVRIPCYVIIFLLGVIGNTLVIVTLLQNRKMRTITNVFLLNLAFSDLLLGVFCMPFTLVGSLLRDFIFGAVMCRLIPYFQAVSVSVSVWTLVAISLERFYAICQPLKSRGWQTLSHAYKIISLVWLLSLVFMAPIAVLSQLLPVGDTSRHKCREMWPSLHFERGFSMFLGAGLLLVPLIIMVAAYSSITVSLWHGMKLERETGQGTEPLISLTDLNGLVMVQQSLRRKQSRRHVSKISIRFRKIPAQRPCVHCGRPESETSLSHASSTVPGHSHACLHDRDCENNKWCVESVRENSAGGAFGRNGHALEEDYGAGIPSPCSRRPTKPDFKRLRSTHLEKSIEAKKHVIRMLFVVVLEFFLCWTPIFVVNIMCLYIPEQVYRTLGSVGISFMHLLSYASSCCNPITYCFMNKKFLQGFRYAFGCRKETERIGRKNATAASFRSQSNNIFKLATEVKRDARETTV